MTQPNRLATETSPYLRQHQHQPVDWYPWSNEAFAEAQQRNVPIMLSVGYSSCHWCHVMAHECFEDAEVAAVLNRNFVSIKVDREERPDVDALYMDAVQALTQRGGWPMTVFLTPTGEPFFGGTYFPRPAFLELLDAVTGAWHDKRDEIDQNVRALIAAISQSTRLEPAPDLPGTAVLSNALEELSRHYDPLWGGFGSAPKFPSTMNLEVVMRALHSTESPQLAEVLQTTLDAMASGGMYDHLGGGFARYSTDRQWLVPHFEKMLYDQAMLLGCYVHGWQLRSNEHWAHIVAGTVDYVLDTLATPEGGWCSSEDADSADQHGTVGEGEFYLWTADEVRAAVGPDDVAVAIEWFGISETGNFEGRSIPNRLHARGILAPPPEVDRARRAMFAVRAYRPRPALDDKVLTEWNALFLAALAQAAGAFARSDWLAAAIRNGEFLLAHLRRPDGRWCRSWQRTGGARHDALAGDHAALVDAFTRLGEASGEARWIGHARECADLLLDHFWDPERGGVFTTADDAESLVVRQKDIVDNASPSANSATAVALYRLSALTGETRYANHADRILQLLAAPAGSAPLGFGNLLCAVAMRAGGLTEVAVVGERSDLVHAVQRAYLPDTVLAWGEPYDSPLWDQRTAEAAYVCRNHTCQAPAHSVEALIAALRTS